MDIFIYDFEFNCIHIIPNRSIDTGYISANAEIDFRGDGSFEIVYRDEVFRKLLKTYPDGLFIKWGLFEGIITDWQNKKSECRIFGTHLNGLLHKEVIPIAEETTDNLKTLVKNVIDTYYSWLTWDNTEETFENVTYSTDSYLNGNEYISEMVKRAHSGYTIYMDIKNKCLKFKLLPQKSNPIILAEGNLNASDFQADYDLKTAATSGWYEKEVPEGEEGDPVWTFIPGTKSGLYNQTVVLKATTEAAATAELADYKKTYDITCQTHNINFGDDYSIGDLVRVLYDDVIYDRIISAVKIWYEEDAYHEEPVLSSEEDIYE